MALGYRFRKKAFDKIYCSDLLRCKEVSIASNGMIKNLFIFPLQTTKEIVNHQPSTPVVYEKRLRERVNFYNYIEIFNNNYRIWDN